MTSDLFHVYDTTLRDGAQQEGLNLSVADSCRIARHIDGLGVEFIEGGWPGANPKDTEFFRRAREELALKHARGGVRDHPASRDEAADDPLVAALRDSGAGVVTLVAKCTTVMSTCAAHDAGGEPCDGPRHRRHLRAEGQRVSWTRSTSSTATATTVPMPWRCCALPSRPAPT